MLDRACIAADVVVLNTCTVTAAADSQARDAVRKIHRANPAARIVVTGCYAQRARKSSRRSTAFRWVVGNSHQTEIPRLRCENLRCVRRRHAAAVSSVANSSMLLESALRPRKISHAPPDLTHVARARPRENSYRRHLRADRHADRSGRRAGAGDRTRPILKIQDGCNNRCSYCVIPFVRGRSRSLPPG